MDARSLKYVTLDVFTSTRYTGNPLAIVELQDDDHNLSTEQLQLIAREFNFSETVFLYRRRDELGAAVKQWRIRIFLTNAEIPFAGHPVVGTAAHIKSRLLEDRYDGLLRLTCPAGNVDFDLRPDDTYLEAQVPHDVRFHAVVPTHEQIVKLQPSLKVEHILGTALASPVKGMNFVLVELDSLAALATVSPCGIGASVTLDQGWDHGPVGTAWYVRIGELDGVKQYRTRMIKKIIEDPATGSMSCALAAWLSYKHKTSTQRYEFIQGVEMGRESKIGVSVSWNDDLKQVKTISLRGTAVHVMKGVLEI